MVTSRELLIASIAAGTTTCVTAGVWAAAPVLSSSIFDWNTMKVETTDVGARRTVFRAPTATLDELECHITTLNPGQTSHAPHRHPEEEILIVREGTVESLVNGSCSASGRVGDFPGVEPGTCDAERGRHACDVPRVQLEVPGMGSKPAGALVACIG